MTPLRRARPAPGSVVVGAALLAALVGLGVVALGPWRLGLGILGSALVVSSFARTLLPERHAGLLGVRRATADVVAMTVLGVVIVTLAVLIPDRPTP